jgi:aspartokinase/homoserine dehydrogenase 1
MIVHKFGGTSLGSAERIAAVADILAHPWPDDGAGGVPVVVVSAMSGVTSRLIAGARAAADGLDTVARAVVDELRHRHQEAIDTLLGHSPERMDLAGLVEDRLHELDRLYRSIGVLGELTARGQDAVAAFGEPLAAALLAAVLRSNDSRARAWNATELVVTDDAFGEACPCLEATRSRLEEKIRPLLAQGVIPVLTGYIGATDRGVATTLGRGGSDYSAAIVGASLGADEVWIWSDVDGILTADPNLEPAARTLPELSYTEAAHLAFYGADVLHPKTIRPLASAGIPLNLRNSFRPDHPGTRVLPEVSAGRTARAAIISSNGLGLIAVGSVDNQWSLPLSARMLARLGETGADVRMFAQSLAEHSLQLVVPEEDQAHAVRVIRRELEDLPKEGRFVLESREQVATVAVVGLTPDGEDGIAPRAFAALGGLGTRVIAVAQTAAADRVSFCIPAEQLGETVHGLHRALGLEDGHE